MRVSPGRRACLALVPSARTGSWRRWPDAHSAPRASPPGSARRSRPAPTRAGRHARQASRRVACALRRARPIVRPLTAAVGRASVGRDEQRDVVVAVVELDLDADALEERRRRSEEQAVDTGLEIGGELREPGARIGLRSGVEALAADLDRAPARP